MHPSIQQKNASIVIFLSMLLALVIHPSPASGSELKETQAQDIEQKIRNQLNSAFDLQEWSHSSTKKTQKGPVAFSQLSLSMKAKLKEPLYQSAGRNQNGMMIIEESKAKGSIIDLQGTAMVISMGGLGKDQIQVILGPAPQGKVGNPLSVYPKNSYVITDANTKPETPQPVNQNDPVTKTLPNPIDKILDVFTTQGEVWGKQRNGQYADTPVVLREIKRIDEYTLKGIIEHPYPQYRNEFEISGIAPKLALKIKRSRASQTGIPVGLYAASPEGDTLVVRRNGPIFALSAAKSEEIRDDFARQLEPWRFKGKISDYGQMGNLLINLDTLEVVSDAWLNRPVAPISNLPGHFWQVDSSNYALSTQPYGAYRAGDVHTLGPRGQAPINPLANVEGQTWVAADLSQYISLREGDLWIGTLDWKNNSSSEARNLTNIGLLNDLKPITWCGKNFFFSNPQATQKPILRINTQTGDIAELAETKALNHKSQGSPDGRFLLFSDGGRMTHTAKGAESRLHVFDCIKNESFSFDSTIDERHYLGTQKRPRMAEAIMPQTWLNSSLFIGVASGQIGWFDLGQRKRLVFADIPEIVAGIPFTVNHGGFIKSATVPGNRFIDITLRGTTVQNPTSESDWIKRRFRVDRLQGSAIQLPWKLDAITNPGRVVTWVDENRYIYPRRKGSFSEIGTWLYDLRSGKNTRLTPFFSNGKVHAENLTFTDADQVLWATPLYTTNPYLVLPDKNRAIFVTTRGKVQELVSVSLAGGDLIRQPAPDGQKHGGLGRLRRIHPFPISLPFAKRLANAPSADSINKMTMPTNSTGTVNASTKATVTPPAMSAAEQETEEVKAMCYTKPEFRTNFECECFAEKFLAKRLEMGPDLQQTVILGILATRAAACLNLPEIRKKEYASCMRDKSFPARGIEYETYCQCYADKATSDFSSYTGRTLSINKKNTLRRVAMVHCAQPSSY